MSVGCKSSYRQNTRGELLKGARVLPMAPPIEAVVSFSGGFGDHHVEQQTLAVIQHARAILLVQPLVDAAHIAGAPDITELVLRLLDETLLFPLGTLLAHALDHAV